MSWLTSFLSPQRGYQHAQKQLEKYYDEAQGYNKPYNQNALDTYGGLSEAFNNLMHPEKLQDEWGKNYNLSDQAKQTQAMAGQQGLEAASSMGLMGSSPAIQAIQSGKASIGAQDKQNYMNDMMNKYMTGIGLGQGIYNTGANAAGQMSNTASQMGENTAQTSFGGQNAGGQAMNNMIKMIAEYMSRKGKV